MEHLTASGILTYKPGVATGKCRAPYVVVRGGGAYARGMSGAAGIGYRTVTLYCFVPRVGGDLVRFRGGGQTDDARAEKPASTDGQRGHRDAGRRF